MKSAPHLLYITLLVQVFVTVGALEQQQQQGSSQGSSPSDADGGYCQDRFGILDAASFTSRSCVMCYVFLFPMRKDLVPLGPNYEHLVPRNHTLYLLHGPISPDPDNATSVEQVCGLLANEEECSRWVSCCEAANACCQQQHSKPRDYDVTNTCHRVWDGYSCWDDTPGGTTVSVACPPFLALSLSGRVSSKQCIKNGTWYQKAGYEWTDYTSCLDKEGYLTGVYLCLGCNVASLLLLVPAIIIFCVYRDLTRQHRVRLHINFFVALGLQCVANLLWYLLVHHDLLVNQDSSETVFYKNPVWCRVLSFFKLYLSSAGYFWMFVEGYYLHQLITRAFEPPKSLLRLHFLGWVTPVFPVVVYGIVRAAYKDVGCWAKSLGGAEWIYYGPNLVCLLVNLIFLCNILRILLFQLHSHPHEPSNFRRGLKATFMLIPLFGLQLFLILYRLPAGTPGFKEYEYVQFIFTNAQGAFVSLVFCFFNGEVLSNLQVSFGGSRFGRSRSQSNHVTQATIVEDRRSPTVSQPSQSSTSPKRNGHLRVNGYQDIDLQEMQTNSIGAASSASSASAAAAAAAAGKPASYSDRKDGYLPLPSTNAAAFDTSRL